MGEELVEKSKFISLKSNKAFGSKLLQAKVFTDKVLSGSAFGATDDEISF